MSSCTATQDGWGRLLGKRVILTISPTRARRASPTNDPDLPVRRVCRDLPPGLVGGGSWKSDDGARRQSDGVVSSREEEFVYLDYFMYGLSTQIFLYGVFVEIYHAGWSAGAAGSQTAKLDRSQTAWLAAGRRSLCSWTTSCTAFRPRSSCTASLSRSTTHAGGRGNSNPTMQTFLYGM